MLPTPTTSHLTFQNIYPPSEDSYHLLDTLSSTPQTTYLSSRFPSPTPTPIILELGTGSGIVLAFLTANSVAIFGRADILALGTDVNPFACVATTETARENWVSGEGGLLLDVLNGSLATPLRRHAADVLVFNPPYVPSETLPALPLTASATTHHELFTRDNAYLALATDGGADGMETTDALLAQLDDVLSARGVAYILLCEQNRPQSVAERLRAQGWEVLVVGESGKQGGWERLCVLRVARGA